VCRSHLVTELYCWQQCRGVMPGCCSPKAKVLLASTGEQLVSSERVVVDAETGMLRITDAVRDDAGEWECVAVNELGTGSATTTLNYIGQ